MTTTSALRRLEGLLADHHPDRLVQMAPGLDDEGVEQLRAALEPMRLPQQVEHLYRWRNGGDSGVFGGWRLRPVGELLEWRAFCLEEMEEPPAWLQLFDDQCLAFTSLDVPGQPASDTSVWYGHTHDASVNRLFDSIEALVDVCADALAAGQLHDVDGRLVMDATDSVVGRQWDTLRRRRGPGTFVYPDPPAGTYLSRFPDAAWPEPWLASLGRGTPELRPHEAMTTIAGLLADAGRGSATGLIEARLDRVLEMRLATYAISDDGSGQLMLEFPVGVTPFPLMRSSTYQFDVTVPGLDLFSLPSNPDDPRGSEVRSRMFPPAVRGVVSAVWPLDG